MANEILYKFVQLELTNFTTFEEIYIEDNEDIEISNKFQFAYDFENNLVWCTTSVIFSKATGTLLNAELSSYFMLDKQSAELLKDEDNIVLPPELLAQFASLSYGSMRGVIYAKTMDSPLRKIILPPNNVSNVFTAPLKFKMK